MPKNDPYAPFNRRVNAAMALKSPTSRGKVILTANQIYKDITDKLKH